MALEIDSERTFEWPTPSAHMVREIPEANLPNSMKSQRVFVALNNLRADGAAGSAISALREAGIRSILLKGPSIVSWLYEDPAGRPYG
ncbi:MAG: nucleotidyltransferase family protein, partial [Acidimicrobiia bacterium]